MQKLNVELMQLGLDGNEKACVNSMEEAEAIVSEIKANVVEPIELNLEIEEQEKK